MKVTIDTNNLIFEAYNNEDTFLKDPELWINRAISSLHTAREDYTGVARANNDLREQVEILVRANASVDRLRDALAAALPALYQIVEGHELANSAMQRQGIADLAATLQFWISDQLTTTDPVD